MSRDARPTSGFTLIELMVAMALVGLIFAAAAAGLRSVFDQDLKNAAARLGATSRYLADKAVTDHLYLRLVYDLDQRAYHVEESGEPFLVSLENNNEPPKKEGEEAPPPEEGFVTLDEGELKPVSLPSGVFFKDVATSYAKAKFEEGKAYTYFFPDGFITETMVNFRDESDEEHYSVEISSLSGKVSIEGGYRDLKK